MYRARLLHLKGKKHVKVTEVPLSHKSLNSGDVFIVDAGTELIQWNGKDAGVMEKSKAASLVQAIEGMNRSKMGENILVLTMLCRRAQRKSSRKSDRRKRR